MDQEVGLRAGRRVALWQLCLTPLGSGRVERGCNRNFYQDPGSVLAGPKTTKYLG